MAIDVSALNRALPASCYVNNVVPSTFPTGPLTLTLQAVSFERLGFDLILEPSSSVLRLGQAPEYRFPEAIVGGTRTGSGWGLTGELQVAGLGPVTLARSAIETRTHSTRVTFTRNGNQASGTLTIAASYRCVDNGPALADQCPRSAPFAPDAAECSVTFPFTAQQLTQIPAWALPSSPTTAEAFVLLHDEPLVDNASCYVGNRVPQARFASSNLRRVQRIQRVTLPSGQGLSTSFASFALGDAPVIRVGEPFRALNAANQFGLTQSTTSVGPLGRTSMERRSTSITMPFAPQGGFLEADLSLSSTYSCTDTGAQTSQRCPLPGEQPAFDSASCSVRMPFVAYRLP